MAPDQLPSDDELMEFVAEVLDREAERAMVDQGMAIMGAVSIFVDRAEAVRDLRAAEGKPVSGAMRETLTELRDQLMELRDVLSGAGSSRGA